MELKKYNKDSDFSFSLGAFPTYELLKNKTSQVKEILIHEKLEKSKDIDNILKVARANRIPIHTNGKLIEKISGKGNIYIVGIFNKYTSRLNENSNHVLLVNPSDMGNLGTIIRVMLGFGYKDLAIIKPCIDHFDPKVIRASMGSIFSVNIQTFDCYQDYERLNNNCKYPFMLKANTTLQKLSQKQSPHTLIFGNEASGLNDNFLNVGTPLLISHSKDIDSLNLSMSVGIALYEFSK